MGLQIDVCTQTFLSVIRLTKKKKKKRKKKKNPNNENMGCEECRATSTELNVTQARLCEEHGFPPGLGS